MIFSSNIGGIMRLNKDKKGKIEFVNKFNPIGIVEDYANNNESNNCKLSLIGKIRTVSMQSGRKKIDYLRKNQGGLINTNQQ